eukprot:1393949-Amorphochlora_amoeboformis.AAC.2
MKKDGVQRDAAVYTSAISAAESEGRWKEALSLLDGMEREGISLNTITCNAAISAVTLVRGKRTGPEIGIERGQKREREREQRERERAERESRERGDGKLRFLRKILDYLVRKGAKMGGSGKASRSHAAGRNTVCINKCVDM